MEMNDGIRVASRGAGGFSLCNVSPEETDKLEAMALGHAWCMIVNGRLQSQSRWELLPKPAADETMMPYWQPVSPGHAQLELRGIETPPGAQAGIMIQSLCGYEYSPENYRRESEKLERTDSSASAPVAAKTGGSGRCGICQISGQPKMSSRTRSS
jgi:hypothetical protein